MQLAKAFGAEVTGVCSTTKQNLVRSIGADHVIDYTRDVFAEARQRYDVILDISGARSLSHLRRALAPRGTVMFVVAEGGNRWTGGIGRQLRAVMHRAQRRFLASGCSTYHTYALRAPRIENPTVHGTSPPSRRNPARYAG